MFTQVWSRITIIVALLGALLGAEPASKPAPANTPAETPLSDLVVSLQHVGGAAQTYRDEISRMELILDPTGRLDQVHLILRGESEPDTHVWYNMTNLVSIRYQFLAITGKGKVTVRTTLPPTVAPAKLKEQTEDPRKRLTPLDPDDYR